MYILNAEKRDMSINAKRLRRSGMIPGSIYGSNLDEALLIQLHQHEVKQLLKLKSAGNKVSLNIGSQVYVVMIREISRNPIDSQIENISFQSLVNDEMVTSAARIVLLNKEKVTYFIQQRLFEIPYRAYPSNLVEKTEFDLEGKPAGTYVRVEDLDICKNKDIELMADPSCLVLSITGGKKLT